MQDEMAAWLEKKRPVWLLRYVQIAEDASRFPHYAELGALARRSLFQREVNGLISYLVGDAQRLKEIQATHEIQAEEITANIPLDEQLEFLDARIEMIVKDIEGDPDTASFRSRTLTMMEGSRNFYRAKLRAYELDQ